MSDQKQTPDVTTKEKAVRAAIAMVRHPMLCLHTELREKALAAVEQHGVTIKDLLDNTSDLSQY